MNKAMSNFKVGFVIFPDLTQLDLTGPLQVLARLPQSSVFVIAKSLSPVPSDCGLSLVPTHRFADCPPLDLICIPGGVKGVIGAIADRETIELVRHQSTKRNTSPPFALVPLFSALPDCSKDGGRRHTGPTRNCCLWSGRSMKRQESSGTAI